MKKNIIFYIVFALLFTITLVQANAQSDRNEIHVGNSTLWVELFNDKVYVTNPTDGKIAVIDELSNKLIGEIDAGKGVILFEPVKDKNKIYATYDSNNKVSVFDLTSFSKIKDIDLGHSVTTQSNNLLSYEKMPDPYVKFPTNGIGLAYDPNNEMLYVVQSGVNRVDVIDTRQDVPVKTIPVGTTPVLIKIDQETNKGYVTNWESNDISVIDLNSNNVTASLKIGSVPNQMAIDPINEKLYVTNHASPNVSVIDLKNQTIVKEIQLLGPTHSIVFDPKKDLMYVTYVPTSPTTGPNSFINRIELIDTTNDTLVGGYDISANPFSTAIDADKQRLFGTIYSNGTLVNLDISKDPRYSAPVPEFDTIVTLVLLISIISMIAIVKFRSTIIFNFKK